MNKKIFSQAAILTCVTIISKITGFLREYSLARAFGTSYQADAYTIALNVPVIIFSSFMVAVSSCYISMYATIKHENSEADAMKFTNNIGTITTLIAGCFAILIILFPEVVVKIFASGFTGEAYLLTVKLVQLSAIMLLAMPLAQIFAAFLQIYNQPSIAAANNILYNIIMICAFMCADMLGITGIALIGGLAYFSQIVVQYPFLRKHSFKPCPYFTIDRNILSLCKLILPVLVSSAVLEINTLIDRTMASGLIEGSVSSLNYAKKLTDLFFGVMAVSISAIVYPKLTELYAEGNTVRLQKLFKVSFQAICIISVPLLILTMVFSKEVVQIIYGHGSFSEESVALTGDALFFYAIGMVFCATRDLLTKVFYAIKKTRVAMINSIFATIANIVLNFILIKPFGHCGLAFASSISMGITSILLVFSLNNEMDVDKKELLYDVLKASVVAIILGIVCKFVYSLFPICSLLHTTLRVAIFVIAYLLVYGIACYLMRISIIRDVVLSLKLRK